MIQPEPVPLRATLLTCALNLPRPTTLLETKILCWYASQTTGNLLEIGCQLGITTAELATHCSPRTVIAVDYLGPDFTVRGLQEREIPTKDTVCQHARHLPNVEYVDCKSDHLLLTQWHLGFVFIDGDHSYAGVRKDTDLVISYFSSGLGSRPAYVFWHDYLEAPWCGVKRFLDEQSASFHLCHVADTHLVYWRIGAT